MSKTADTIAQLLRNGWTLKSIAERAGVHETTLYRWQAGKVPADKEDQASALLGSLKDPPPRPPIGRPIGSKTKPKNATKRGRK